MKMDQTELYWRER